MIKAIAGNKILKIPRKKLKILKKKKKSISLKLGKDHYLILSQVKVLVAQSCPTLCNPMDCSPPGYTVHGIFQARILEWVPISFSRGSSQPRHRTWVSHIAGRFFTIWATEPHYQKTPCCDFPGGLVAKTVQPQRRGSEFDPWSQN